MTFLLKIAYYALMAVSSLAAVFYLIVGLFDSTRGTPVRERVVILIASAVAIGLLYQAFRLGHQQGQWGAGLGMAIAAIFAFILIMLVGMLTGKIHWQ